MSCHASSPAMSCRSQLQLELRMVAGRDALRQALLAMVPQIDEMQRKRELMKVRLTVVHRLPFV